MSLQTKGVALEMLAAARSIESAAPPHAQVSFSDALAAITFAAIAVELRELREEVARLADRAEK